MDHRRSGAPNSASPPSSASSCPACGKPIDALRAGHVAILGGAFRYFCDATCKDAYVDATSRRSQLDAMTAEPPAVASATQSLGTPSAPVVVVSGVREQAPHFPAVRPDAVSVREEEAEAPREDEARAAGEVEVQAGRVEPDPSTLRSPHVDEALDEETSASAEARDADDAKAEPEPEAPEEEAGAGGPLAPAPSSSEDPRAGASGYLAAAAPIAGVFAGSLSAVVSLAGEPAGILRLPLALVAALIVLAGTALRGRDGDATRRLASGAFNQGEPSQWVVVAPISVAAIAAIVSAARSDPHAEAHASFVGLAAAAALAVEILFARAGRDVQDARARTARALAVSARLARGEELAAAQVKPGEQVLVEAKETVPVDGIVAAGEAEVVPWFGASVVLEKSAGDAVVAGAVVSSGALRVNATFTGVERAWLRLTREGASRIEVAAPLVAFLRHAVERGTPAAALLVGGAVYADNGSWLDVVIAAASGGYALAAAAAVSAAALSHARGHGAAQRRGIVYKDAAAFDAAARADVAVVCSRGTILLGAPEIVVVEAITKDGPTSGASGDDGARAAAEPASGEGDGIARVLALAAGAEMSQAHPFALAILREARARGVRPENVRSALGHSGLGVTALAPSGDRVIVGSRAFLLQEKVSVAIVDARTSELEAQGRSVLLVAVAGRLVGLLALQDGLRPGARAAIQRMHDARIEPILLTGEARDTSETIARALDIEHVRPEILPADRGGEVRSLSDGGRVVAALGHASTDDGALGAADVSVAMEAAGAAPGEWSVALASDDVRDAALALTIPRACRDRARTAMVAGLLTQAVSALGVAFGIASPAVAPVLGFLAAVVVVAIVRDPHEEPSAGPGEPSAG